MQTTTLFAGVASAFALTCACAQPALSPEARLVKNHGQHVTDALALLNAPLPDGKDATACAFNASTLLAVSNIVRPPVLHDMLAKDGVAPYAGRKPVAPQAWNALAEAMPRAQQRWEAVYVSDCMKAITRQAKSFNQTVEGIFEKVVPLQLSAITNMTAAINGHARANKTLSQSTCELAQPYATLLAANPPSIDGTSTPAAKSYQAFQNALGAVCR